MTPCELTASVTAIANMLASKLDDTEIAVWGAIFTQLGDTLETIAVQRDALKKSCRCINENSDKNLCE